MKKNKTEGNLISWKLVVDKNNNYITELSFLKEKVKVLIRHVKNIVAPLHEQLQSKVK